MAGCFTSPTGATVARMGIFLREPQGPSPTLAASAPPPSRRARSAPYNIPRAITASAERITISSMSAVERPYAEWQREAWTGYERVGEVHYGFNLLANLLSRVRFYAAEIGEANEPPRDLGTAADRRKSRVKKQLAADATAAIAELQHRDFASSVRAFSLNLSVPGECYLIHLPTKTGKEWTIRSVDEVQVRLGGATLIGMRGNPREQIQLPPDTYIARMWRRHPRWSKEPDSSMVGVADSIEELLMLQRLVRGAARSRMNAGLLFVPDGISGGMTATQTHEPPLEEPGSDDPITALQNASVVDPGGKFMQQLMESMVTPVTDEGSASAVVPMLAQGPGELGQQIRHITFERGSDEWLVRRIEAALERILQGIDIPKEIVTGLQNVKYSNAVVIDENLYRANIEPLALVFADALTEIYLRAVLRAKGYSDEELADIVVWYDPSEIVTRPNSGDDATQGADRLMISPSAWRREHGFAESDAPTEEDLSVMLLQKMTALPEPVMLKLLQQALPKLLADADLTPAPAPNVVQFPGQAPPAPVVPDPQRVAVKQVGGS